MEGWTVESTGVVVDLADLEPGEEWTARDFDPMDIRVLTTERPLI